MFVGSASIIGIPLIGGFWSRKELSLTLGELQLSMIKIHSCVPSSDYCRNTGYMSRMWFMTFAGKPKTEVAEKVHEQTPWFIPLLVLIPMSLAGIVFASLKSTYFLGYKGYKLGEDGLLEGFLYEMDHIFVNPGTNYLLVLTYIAIFLSMVLGPCAAMALHGGRLDETKAKPWMQWAVTLSGKLNDKYSFAGWAEDGESSFGEALRQRLYFDKYYDMAMMKIVAGFSNLSASFDKNVVDGFAIKTIIEKGGQDSSRIIRSITTGSARDYIMMVAVGTLAIAILLWGVN